MSPPPLPPSASIWPPGHPRHPDSLAAYQDDDGDDGDVVGYDDDEGRDAPTKMRSVQFRDRPSAISTLGNSSAAMTGGSGGTKFGNKDEDDGDIDDDDDDDLFESDPEPTTLPESTHTLFFTHPVCSIAFAYATMIVVVSIMCLVMALADNLDVQDRDEDNPLEVPANVKLAVKIAQYLAILVALLMEEEIPTGLHLLRTIPRSAFAARFPTKSYCKFVLAALLRIAMGYIFLVNVFIILAQASGVIDIFYDVLALQFIQQLDDIAFALAKMDVIGKRLKRACTARLYQTEFERQKFRRSMGASLLLKSMYFVNLGLFLFGMIWISINQMNGDYQCKEITVDFGDDIWEDALVVTESGDYKKRLLVFSTFNGVYAQDGTHEGRPLYRERRKLDQEPFGVLVVPAEIKYDAELGSWVFSHPLISKSESEESPWLLRSPQTEEFDVLNVDGDWSVWNGVISNSVVTYSCLKCDTSTDCNLNGQCIDGACECHGDEQTGLANFLGPHCEVKLKESCGTIIAEGNTSTFSTIYYSESGEGPDDTLFQQYNRPIYSYIDGSLDVKEDDITWLIYTGRRWIYVNFNLAEDNTTFGELIYAITNYHAFWNERYTFDSDTLVAMSDSTTADTPVGVDWFLIGERGSQFGPFGALYPLQKDELDGRGVFRCAGPRSTFTQGNTTNSTSG